jgi:hypothetical protein
VGQRAWNREFPGMGLLWALISSSVKNFIIILKEKFFLFKKIIKEKKK